MCFFSPWQFLFWYDQPATAKDEPELALIKDLPTTVLKAAMSGHERL
ncbi:MAG: hypothetical protein ACI9NQ_001294 [Paracoccaceae bacterium]